MYRPQTKVAVRLEAMERSQAWLARKLGVTRQTIGAYVRGADRCPPARQAQIATIVERKPSELFDGDGYASRRF